MTQIWVIDLETTGLDGILRGDKVLEVGVARVCLDNATVYPEFSQIVKEKLSEDERQCWAFKNTTLKPADCEYALYDAEDIGGNLSILFDNKPFTSYNRSFDFDKFLNYPPWRENKDEGFNPTFAPCLKEVYADVFNDGRWISAQECYNILCPDNPAGLPEGKELHRALDDAIMEGWILVRMCEKNPAVRMMYDICWQQYGGAVND